MSKIESEFSLECSPGGAGLGAAHGREDDLQDEPGRDEPRGAGRVHPRLKLARPLTLPDERAEDFPAAVRPREEPLTGGRDRVAALPQHEAEEAEEILRVPELPARPEDALDPSLHALCSGGRLPGGGACRRSAAEVQFQGGGEQVFLPAEVVVDALGDARRAGDVVNRDGRVPAAAEQAEGGRGDLVGRRVRPPPPLGRRRPRPLPARPGSSGHCDSLDTPPARPFIPAPRPGRKRRDGGPPRGGGFWEGTRTSSRDPSRRSPRDGGLNDGRDGGRWPVSPLLPGTAPESESESVFLRRACNIPYGMLFVTPPRPRIERSTL